MTSLAEFTTRELLAELARRLDGTHAIPFAELRYLARRLASGDWDRHTWDHHTFADILDQPHQENQP